MDNALDIAERTNRLIEIQIEDLVEIKGTSEATHKIVKREAESIRFNTGYTFYFQFISCILLSLILWRVW